jgi:hypothetical protein
MKARIAYLTSPSAGTYLLNFQLEHGVEMSIEVSKGHLANILSDGTSLLLRESVNHRVPISQTENVNGSADRTQ